MPHQMAPLHWAALLLCSSLSLTLAIEYTQSNTPTDNQQYAWDSKVSLDFTTLNTLPDNFWTVSDYFAQEKLKRPTIPFDRVYSPQNVVVTPTKGLNLFVQPLNGTAAAVPNQNISCAEIISARQNYLYGSFRARMIFPSANGTVSGFFYYADDANEVDFEFLSKAPDRFWAVIHHTGNLTTWPTLNVVKLTKTGESLAGKEVEVRFDHFPERVDYYVNDVFVTGFSGPWLPKKPGALIINHWSNGDKDFSLGPPAQASALTILSTTFYFNRTTDVPDDAPELGLRDQVIGSAENSSLQRTLGLTFYTFILVSWFWLW